MKQFFIKLLKAFAPVPSFYGGARGRVLRERRFLMSHVRGNVNLQRGRYLTRSDLDARKAKVVQYEF